MKLIEALDILRKRSINGSPFHVALVCSYTPLHLLTLLKAHLTLSLAGRQVEVGTGLYGDLAGTLRQVAVDPVDAVVLTLEWPDLDPRLSIRQLGGWEPERIPEMLEEARRRLARIAELIAPIAARIPVVISLPGLPPAPAAFQPSWQQSPFEAGLHAALAHFRGEMAATANVSVLNPNELDRVSPPASRHDVKAELASGFPYQIAHADALAALLARLAAPPAAKKGLITDLDDTLWRGILGDEGVDGVSWNMDHHAQIHGYYQQLLRSLARTGVLVGVASKNNPALVEQALARPDLLLRPTDLFPVDVSWRPKSEAVARILEAWNIGADSVVFIDDSPMELDEVRRAYPAIECILFPKQDVEAAYRLGYRLRDLFGKREVSEEDRIRSQSLRAAGELRQAGGGSQADMESFLREAGAALSLTWVRPPLEPRILELINKTNQFNINGRRYTEAEWNVYAQRPETNVLVVEYSDKYGPLGKIAVLTGSRQGARFQVDTWVMSCRAFSRRIEYHTLREIFDRWDVDEAAINFHPTGRNQPSAEFFASLLDAPPEGAFALSRTQFAQRCPALYPQLVESAAE
jgi:FkbH-like protein